MADDGGLSPGDLAEQRGISKDEGRRLVKAGKVPAHQTSGIHGLTWCVHPDGDMPERNGGASPAPGLHQGSATPAQPADVAALVGLVDRLTAENHELVNAVDAWQSQAVVLAGRLVDAEERLALTAPSTPVEAPTTAEHAQTAPEPSTGHWWRRWRAWLAAGLVVVVLGAASCQTAGVAAGRQNLCPAAQQSLAVADRSAGSRRQSFPEGRWIIGNDEWQALTTVAGFIKSYC